MTQRRWLAGALGFLLISAVLVGCGSSSPKESSRGVAQSAASAPSAAAPTAPGASVADKKAQPPASVNGTTAGGDADVPKNAAPSMDSRKLVYTADVNIQVVNVDQSLVQIQNLADFYHGYVSGMRKSGSDDAGYNGQVSLRIPTESFSEAMSKVRGLATKVKDEKADVQDVTNQFVDLDSRLKAAREHEATLRNLALKSGTLDELMRLQNEIERVRSQIESMQGNMNVLSNQIALSTITVSMIQPAPDKKPEPVGGKKGLGRRIADAWESSMEVTTSIVTGLIVFVTALVLPVGSMAIIALVVWWVVRRVRGSWPGARKPSDGAGE